MKNYHASIRYDIVPLVPECGKLLDVGGGYGATARHLKEIGRARKVGVMDAVADQHSDGLDTFSTVNLDDQDAVSAYLNDAGPFDAILMLDVLEHLVDPWGAVITFSHALRPGGVMIASIPNVRHFSVSGKLFFGGSWQYAEAGLLDRTHLRFFVRESAIDLMDVPGMTIEKVEPSLIGATKYRFANAMTFGRLRSLFTLHYFVLARKVG